MTKVLVYDRVDKERRIAPRSSFRRAFLFPLSPAICTLSKKCCGCPDRGLGRIGEGNLRGLSSGHYWGNAPRSISGGINGQNPGCY